MKKSRKEIVEVVDSVVRRVWSEDMKNDYDNGFLLREDSMKNAFYYHLRTRLSESFIMNNNLRIFTEYYIEGERIDLVVVKINPKLMWKEPLENCVTDIIATIEIKMKGAYVSNIPFYKDVDKVLRYIKTWGKESTHYLAFIQEKYFDSEEVVSWLNETQDFGIKGKDSRVVCILGFENR